MSMTVVQLFYELAYLASKLGEPNIATKGVVDVIQVSNQIIRIRAVEVGGNGIELGG